jgi:hypothetical protein
MFSALTGFPSLMIAITENPDGTGTGEEPKRPASL